MKNEILDTPFLEKISDVLEKGETILWSEQPRQSVQKMGFHSCFLNFPIIAIRYNYPFSIKKKSPHYNINHSLRYDDNFSNRFPFRPFLHRF